MHRYLTQSMLSLHLGEHVKGIKIFWCIKTGLTITSNSWAILPGLLCNERNAATPWRLHGLSSWAVSTASSPAAPVARVLMNFTPCRLSISSNTLQMHPIFLSFSRPWDSQWPRKVLVQSRRDRRFICVLTARLDRIVNGCEGKEGEKATGKLRCGILVRPACNAVCD